MDKEHVLISKLPKRVILLGWVSFFADVSSEMIYPLLPVFLHSVLGAPVLVLGVIEGVAQAVVSVMAAMSGIFSDRIRRRVGFVRWGYGLPILGKALICVATSWHVLLMGRLIDRFGKGLRGSPRDALIADAIEVERRGEAFGYHRMMDTAGASLGVLIAAAFLWVLPGESASLAYRAIFGLSALLAVFSFVVACFVSETSSSPASAVQAISCSGATRLHASQGLGRKYWSTLAILAIFAFANSSDTFLLLRASHLGFSGLEVVLGYALYNLTYALFSQRSGRLSDFVGRWAILLAGWFLYAIVYAGFASLSVSYLWLLFPLYGVYMALTEGVSKALIVDCAPAARRGEALGILYMVLGLSALSSNLLAGYLWDRVGTAAPFWLGSCTALVAVGFALPLRLCRATPRS